MNIISLKLTCAGRGFSGSLRHLLQEGEELMKQIRKKEGNIVKAYCLEEDSPVIKRLAAEEKIRFLGRECWRIFSRESKEGELACSGDYIKLDLAGNPYPNTREFFLRNHRHIGGDEYEQLPRSLSAWCAGDKMCPEIRFLVEHKGLKIGADDENAYFSAPLWGDVLSAAKDAVIVFYDIAYDAAGEVTDADFNFVARDEFEKRYDILST